MKILMVAIPNHHFFQWVNQLKDSGHQVFWFDVTDGGAKSPKIDWVEQIKGWKLKIDYPFRTRLKKAMPKLYAVVQKNNENEVTKVFKKHFDCIKPDVVHCFEMELAGLPILSVMEQNKVLFIYSSWGSDVYYFKEKGINSLLVKQFYKRVNYLITDCKRDYELAVKYGFKNSFLGVFPGNGGLCLDKTHLMAYNTRKTILIKGYNDGVGKASEVIKALELLPKDCLGLYEIIVYSADNSIVDQIQSSVFFSDLKVVVYSRSNFIKNTQLLEIMGRSCIHIANSLSDGMPNALLEAMGMGAFPIQSNPGNVSEEVIKHNKNGFLISNPLDRQEIANHIENALKNDDLRKVAQDYNVNFITNKYDRKQLQPQIKALYNSVYTKL